MQRWLILLLIAPLFLQTSCRQKKSTGTLQRTQSTTPFWAVWVGSPTIAVRSCEKFSISLRNGITEAQTLEGMNFALSSSQNSRFYEDPYCTHPITEAHIAKDEARVSVYFLADNGGTYNLTAAPVGVAFPPASFLVNVNGRAFLESSTEQVDFGTVTVGESKIITVTLTNNGTSSANDLQQGLPLMVAPFRFSGNAYPGLGGSCGGKLEEEESCTLNLEYAPEETGVDTGMLVINFSDDLTASSVTLHLNGVGG